MPTYEYACKSCGERLEVVQSFSDEPLTECPNCGGQLRKMFGSIGIAFKGSGFYKTDSRNAGKKAKTAASSEAGAGSGSGDSGATSTAAASSSSSSSSESSSSSSSSSDSSSPSSTSEKAKAS